MQYFPFTLSSPAVAGDTKFFEGAGKFIRYEEETSGAVSPNNRITFKTNNGDAVTLKPGDQVELERQFARLELVNVQGVSSLAGSIAVGGDGARVTSMSLSGTVSVSGIAQASTITNVAEATVGLAEVSVAAASANRKSLRFRSPTTNTDDIHLGATGVTTANGAVTLSPGDTWVENDGAAAQWFAISGTAAQKLRVQAIS